MDPKRKQEDNRRYDNKSEKHSSLRNNHSSEKNNNSSMQDRSSTYTNNKSSILKDDYYEPRYDGRYSSEKRFKNSKEYNSNPPVKELNSFNREVNQSKEMQSWMKEISEDVAYFVKVEYIKGLEIYQIMSPTLRKRVDFAIKQKWNHEIQSGFPGSLAVSLSKKDVDELQPYRFQIRFYWKSDGIRWMCAFISFGDIGNQVVFIDRSYKMFLLHPPKQKIDPYIHKSNAVAHKQSNFDQLQYLFDGELCRTIRGECDFEYQIFDTIVHNFQDISQRFHHDDRIKFAAQTLTQKINTIASSSSQSIHSQTNQSQWLLLKTEQNKSISLQPKTSISFNDVKKFFGDPHHASEFSWKQFFPTEIDGIIVMRNDLPYRSGKDEKLWKWKKTQDMTIDFYLTVCEEEGYVPIPKSRDPRLNTENNKKLLMNHPAYSDLYKLASNLKTIEKVVNFHLWNSEKKEYTIQFRIEYVPQTWNPFVSHFEDLQGKIFECCLSYENIWIPIRQRTDKSIANNIDTFHRTKIQIEENILPSHFIYLFKK